MLNTNKKYKLTFCKSERLKQKRDIDKLFQYGKVLTEFPVQVIYHLEFAKQSNLLAGFTVPKRSLKNAPDRNRIKRIMRESYRLNKKIINETVQNKNLKLYLMFVYKSKEIKSYHELEKKIFILLQRLQTMINKK